MLWALGTLLTTFYIHNILHNKEAEVREEFNLDYEQAKQYIRRTNNIIYDIKHIILNRAQLGGDNIANGSGEHPPAVTSALTPFVPLYPDSNCQVASLHNQGLASAERLFRFWKANISYASDLNRVFLIDADSLCLTDFGSARISNERDMVLKSLHQQIVKYRDQANTQNDDNLYWVSPDALRPESGMFYVLTPLYQNNKLWAMLGIEQSIRLDDFMLSGNLPMKITLLDQANQPLLYLNRGEHNPPGSFSYPAATRYFGYANGYNDLVMKKGLAPYSLSIAYSLSVTEMIGRFKVIIFNAILLNLFSALVLFILAWLFERKMFSPAENNALRLEEHEQFNRKIVASAPVGISILRLSDGTNILSNELAHNYISLLTHDDRERLTRIIYEQKVNLVNVMTSNRHNLQISFVHSRYRNEEVAICVLVDVSSRVKMEESLQEMAAAAEQASQSKTMFLATVSHELRTPLYGIIGNLDLLQTKELPQEVDRLVVAMNNSSGLLLKIISDILDFSKIESEQLKIEPREFSCFELINHITGNYLPLVLRKQLGLYCFIEPNVPEFISGDALRLQQVLSNLLNNAIKFTDTGCIILRVAASDNYLELSVRDTGVGIPPRDIPRLFDPFFQVGNNMQHHFQGTGLGLAICEKLIGMMDGDIAVESELKLGSLFTIRLPLYNARYQAPQPCDGLLKLPVWLDIRNRRLEQYLENLFASLGVTTQRYQSGCLGAGDVLLADYSHSDTSGLLACIELSRQHIGPAIELEAQPGYWLQSTATLHEIPVLLNRLLGGVGQGSQNNLLSLGLSKTEQVDNGDIRLLVVDDHPINRRLLSEQLTSLGYPVVSASDGLDALAVLAHNEVDIVLTDVNMPNMDGYRLTQRLREMGFSAPVIGVTANALAEEKQRCLDAGMDNCLSKPITLDVLQHELAVYSQQVRALRKG